jgi:hypothetical protein
MMAIRFVMHADEKLTAFLELESALLAATPGQLSRQQQQQQQHLRLRRRDREKVTEGETPPASPRRSKPAMAFAMEKSFASNLQSVFKTKAAAAPKMSQSSLNLNSDPQSVSRH